MTTFYDNVTILLQGILHENIDLVDTLNVYTKICNVVLSVYKTDIEKVVKICESFPRVIIMENDIKDYEQIPLKIDREFNYLCPKIAQNGFFQICTTKKALSAIHTEYVIKSRIDHFYSRILKFIQYGLNINKLLISSIYVRGCQNIYFPCKYHLSDCLFMGKTNDIKLCFDLCYNNRLLTLPELGIWKPYLIYTLKKRGVDTNIIDNDTYIKHMLELVDVYCVNKLQPYKIKLGANIQTYMDDKIKTTKEYLLYGCDCN